MADETLNNATEEHPPAAGPGIQVGRDVDGSIITGNNNTVNNVINMAAPAVQAFRSLHQLPQPPDDFTGREKLIAGLLEDFNTHKGATITGRPAHLHGLTGMGGIGKTALGLVVAHQLAMDYPDAQIFLGISRRTGITIVAWSGVGRVHTAGAGITGIVGAQVSVVAVKGKPAHTRTPATGIGHRTGVPVLAGGAHNLELAARRAAVARGSVVRGWA